MSNDADTIHKIKKYVHQLRKEEKIGRALSRLDKIEMTVPLLHATEVGKAVNALVCHEEFGEEARRIVAKWMKMCEKNGIYRNKPKDESDDDEADGDAAFRHVKQENSSPEPYRSPEQSHSREKSSSTGISMKRVKQETSSPPPDSLASKKPRSSKSDERPQKAKIIKKEPGAFEKMLANGDKIVSKPRKLKPAAMDWSQCKPELDLNYRPLPALNLSRAAEKAAAAAAKAQPTEEPFNPEKMFKPRNDRQKVFAGRRKEMTYTEVPTLFNICMRVIQNNIDAIEETGDIPFSILKPVLEKCSAQQLSYIEARNQYLEEDSDELWERLVTKSFPGRASTHDETWKEAFFRFQRENEDRLKMLAQKIGNSHKAESENGKRKAIMADALAPSHIRKRQEKHGTIVNKSIPSALEVSAARRKIFDTGSSSSLAAIPSGVVNRHSTVGAKKTSGTGAGPKPTQKKGALMLKTMKMLNMKRR